MNQIDKNLRRINIEDNGADGITIELNKIDDKINTVDTTLTAKIDKAIEIAETTKKMEGKPGYTPVKGIDYNDGASGKDYILTDEDKKEIASTIEVPVVKKVIEKRETVIRETPIVTEIIKEVLPEDIAKRLNTLKEVVDVSVIKGALSKKDVDEKVLEGMKVVDGRIKAIDQRWRGAGLSKVSHDTTLSGDGTPSSPLVVIGGGGSSDFNTILTSQLYEVLVDYNGNVLSSA